MFYKRDTLQIKGYIQSENEGKKKMYSVQMEIKRKLE